VSSNFKSNTLVINMLGVLAGLQRVLDDMAGHPGDTGRVLLIHAGKKTDNHAEFQSWAVGQAAKLRISIAAVTHNSGTGKIRAMTVQLYPAWLEQEVKSDQVLTQLQQVIGRRPKLVDLGGKISLPDSDINEVMTLLAVLREHVRGQRSAPMHVVIATGTLGDRGVSYRPVKGEQAQADTQQQLLLHFKIVAVYCESVSPNSDSTKAYMHVQCA
jgi:hypothetical protein